MRELIVRRGAALRSSVTTPVLRRPYARPARPQTLAYKPRNVPRRRHNPDPIPILSNRSIPLIGSGVFGAAIALYLVFLYRGYAADVAKSAELNVPADTSDRYKWIANKFDADVEWMEWLMGISKRRKELCAKAKGHVLETSVGTGRNMTYLPLTKGIKSVTMVDKNREMIDVARHKWPDEGNAWFIHATFRVQDCADRVPCPVGHGFDTVLQTMGVCSTGEPEKLLKNLGDMTNPNGGLILLLEHGKSKYDWLNNLMDSIAPAHADRFGCWFNKDVNAIVERSGLEIVEAKRFNFGTTYWFVLKPPKQSSAEVVPDHVSSQKKSASWLSAIGLG